MADMETQCVLVLDETLLTGVLLNALHGPKRLVSRLTGNMALLR